MAVTVLKNVSQDEINWYHETRYWMHVSDEKTRIRAATERGLAEGRAKGLEKGLAEGRTEQALETAKKLIKMKNVTKEQIAEATGLSIKQIEELK